MNADILNLMVFGLAALTVAVTVLLTMVQLELGPLSRLGGHRRWLLAAALGSGVLAFALKLLIIVAVANFPQFVIDPFIEKVALPLQPTATTPSPGPPRYRWMALPESSAVANSPPRAPLRYSWQALPAQAPAPAHNPTTAAKAALGERLFFDADLSRDGTVACASCHDLYAKAGADARPGASGIDGQVGTRNAPTVWNAAFQSRLFWDGRAASLEQQAEGPLLNPLEMGMPSAAAVEARVRGKPDYVAAFALSFGASAPITLARIAEAIAAYERTLITPDTPYDRFVRGDLAALAPAQLRGMALFQSTGCIHCHFGPNFSAASVFDDRVPLRAFPVGATPYMQRYDLVGDTGAAPAGSDRGVWRVPSLRNVALTGPWLHNGAVSELAEVVRIMAGAQLGRSGRHLVWSGRDRSLSTLEQAALSEQEVSDIVAFLQALSSDRLTRTAGR